MTDLTKLAERIVVQVCDGGWDHNVSKVECILLEAGVTLPDGGEQGESGDACGDRPAAPDPPMYGATWKPDEIAKAKHDEVRRIFSEAIQNTCSPDPHEFSGKNRECCLKMLWFGGQAVRCARPADDPIHDVAQVTHYCEVNDGREQEDPSGLGQEPDPVDGRTRPEDRRGDVDMGEGVRTESDGAIPKELREDQVDKVTPNLVGPGDEVQEVGHPEERGIVRGVDSDGDIIVEWTHGDDACQILATECDLLSTPDGRPVTGFRARAPWHTNEVYYGEQRIAELERERDEARAERDVAQNLKFELVDPREAEQRMNERGWFRLDDETTTAAGTGPMAAFVKVLGEKHGRDVAIEIADVHMEPNNPFGRDTCIIYLDGKKAGLIELGEYPISEWSERIDEFIGRLVGGE